MKYWWLILLVLLSGCVTIEGKTYCTEEDRANEFCVFLYDPVCSDTGKTYPNNCIACNDLNVSYYVKGEC